MNPQPAILFGIDIETGGPVLSRHPLLAIGGAIYHWNGQLPPPEVTTFGDWPGLQLLDTLEVHLAGRIEDYDPDTLKFWERNPEAWTSVKQNPIPAEDAAEQLIAWLTKWQGYAFNQGIAFKTITDNCWFDDTWVSWFLCTHSSNGQPLRYNYHSGYTPVKHMIDLNQRTKAFSEAGGRLWEFTPSVAHDHTPVADARGIVESYLNYIRSTANYVRPSEDQIFTTLLQMAGCVNLSCQNGGITDGRYWYWCDYRGQVEDAEALGPGEECVENGEWGDISYSLYRETRPIELDRQNRYLLCSVLEHASVRAKIVKTD